MKFEITIDDDAVADMLSRGEPEAAMWIDHVHAADIGEKHPTVWHALVAGKIDRVLVVLNEAHEGSNRRVVTRESIARGLQIIASLYPAHMSGICGDDATADARTGDAFLQAAALGDLVYG